MASVTYGKSIMSSVIMAKILWQMKLSRLHDAKIQKVWKFINISDPSQQKLLQSLAEILFL